MSESYSRGALVVLCRSKFANHFSSFKPILIERLESRFGDRIQFVDAHTNEELANSLFQPSTLFDIAELHILAEYGRRYHGNPGAHVIGRNGNISERDSSGPTEPE